MFVLHIMYNNTHLILFIFYSSAPEIVGLLSELNDAVEELENKINPIMTKVKPPYCSTFSLYFYILPLYVTALGKKSL